MILEVCVIVVSKTPSRQLYLEISDESNSIFCYLLLAKRLPADFGHFVVDLPEEQGESGSRQFTVEIKFTRPIDLGEF